MKLILLLLPLFFALPGFAQSDVIDQEIRKDKELSKLRLSLGYGVNTDLADQVEPRAYTNFLSFSAGYRLSNVTSINLGVTGAYLGFENGDVQSDENSRDLFLNDVRLGGSHYMSISSTRSVSFFLSNFLPTSSDARREGYNSITSGGASYNFLMFNKRLNLSTGAGANYVWNTYEQSPATLQTNKIGGLSLSASLYYAYYKRMFVTVGAGTQFSQYADSTADQTYRNFISTGYSDGHWSTSIAYVNGTYLDDGDARFWFLDSFRQLVSFSVGYIF